jgi:hypothetical protein
MPLNVGGAHHAPVSPCPRPTVEVTGAGRMAGMSSANPTCTAKGLAPVTVDLEVAHA